MTHTPLDDDVCGVAVVFRFRARCVATDVAFYEPAEGKVEDDLDFQEHLKYKESLSTLGAEVYDGFNVFDHRAELLERQLKNVRLVIAVGMYTNCNSQDVTAEQSNFFDSMADFNRVAMDAVKAQHPHAGVAFISSDHIAQITTDGFLGWYMRTPAAHKSMNGYELTNVRYGEFDSAYRSLPDDWYAVLGGNFGVLWPHVYDDGC